MSAGQMTLPLPMATTYAAAEFIEAPSNEAVRTWLDQEAAWPQGRLAIWGPAGCGKTHLLHLWAARHGAVLLAGGAIDPAWVAAPSGPVAVDDADRAPERALFHLLNAAGEAGQKVLLASRPPPGRWATALPDLASRLRAITAVEIGAADEELLRMLLLRLLGERQLAAEEDVQAHLLLRLPRTPAAIRRIADVLDRLALAARRRGVNRAMANEALALPAGGEDDGDTTDTAGPSPGAGGAV